MANRLGFGKYVTRSQLEHTTLLATRNLHGNIHRGQRGDVPLGRNRGHGKVSPPLLVLAPAVLFVVR